MDKDGAPHRKTVSMRIALVDESGGGKGADCLASSTLGAYILLAHNRISWQAENTVTS